MALVFQYRLVSHVPGSTTTAGNASSGAASFSPDGRYVLFDSFASNLAGSDGNGGSDLFVYDTQDFSVDLVSHIPASTTTAANGPADAARAVFSSDSRYALFASDASNLAGSDGNAGSDLFLYDTQDGSVDLVSHIPASTTTTGNGSADGPAFLSPDGHWVLFDSNASNLASSGDANGSTDVFLYDTLSTSVTLVSHAFGSPTTANGESSSWAFSPDSHNVLFASDTTNLLSTSINPNRDLNLFLFSIDTHFPFTAGQTVLVSHAESSATTSASSSSAVSVATYSPDGRYVLFDSLATNLVANQADTNGVADLFLYDTQTNSSALVSHVAGSTTNAGSGASLGSAIFSPNGRYVLFRSDASNLAANDGNGSTDVFLYDTQDFSVDLVSHVPGSTTTTANGGSGVSTMTFSPDSRYVLFDSVASDLAGTDGNAALDLFLYDTQDFSVDLVSHVAGSATTTGNGASSTVAQPFSQDSRYVLFNSSASDLAATDANGADDAFLYDTLDSSVQIVSATAGGAAANGTSIGTSFGPDGRSVVLQSDATDLGGLALADLNNNFDVFLVLLGNFAAPTFELAAFGANAGGWSSDNTYPRELADVNADGRADIIGFSSAGVYESLATAGGHFATSTFELAAFGVNAGGWSSDDTYPRELADVSGDSRTDIVGFSTAGVYVSLATGNGDFMPPTFELPAFGVSAGGWSSDNAYPRELADVNGDGRADIVGFSSAGVYESLATAGGHFAAPTFELAAFGTNAGGWSSDDTYPRKLADVTGDGMADIVGFGQAGVYVSLATAGGHFAAPTFELAAFGTNAGGWSSNDTYPRTLADVNADHMADIVGFGADGVFVSLATGGGHFASPTFQLSAFGANAGGWNSDNTYPRQLADISGNGSADIVGFATNGVWTAPSLT
jgi:FG-GAP-like repeat/WD40-like Beta Propeller Repeat